MLENAYLLKSGNAAFASVSAEFTALSDKLDRLAEISDSRTASRAAGLKARLQAFSPRITMVGQVKAGKSALVNVLAATPGLLPSDVNPWTSVVTTLAINGKAPAEADAQGETKARFTFFDRDEWDNLVNHGGRLGELAERAGAEEELHKIEAQIDAMRRKTESRLGKHFELLLGQSHTYGYLDSELVERYVCLGDGIEAGDISAATGRFADITKSAEFYVGVPEYDMAMTLCDTPGVNDTFMMREQITLRSLRGSELCVVVLSAHQALSTVDLALMRIIANLENRQVILFINRIDELQEPVRQIAEIRDSITSTLKKFNISSDVAVIFGSAKWGEAALTGSMDMLSADSRDTLSDYIEGCPDQKSEDGWETIWNVSGMPDLLRAIAVRIEEGAGRRQLDRTRRAARNLTNEARARMVAKHESGATVDLELAGGSAITTMAELTERFEGDMGTLCQSLRDDLVQRMGAAENGFVKRATDALVAHLDEFGEQGTWSYDPTGLRVLQRTAYMSFSRALTAKVGALYTDAAAHVQGVYAAMLGDRLGDFRIEPPYPPRVPAPVGLGRTIALDLQSTWWRRWWQKRRGAAAFANDYAHLIRAEVHSISEDVERNQAAAVLENARATLTEFLREHRETIERLANPGVDGADASDDALAELQAGSVTNSAFSEILKDLDDMAA